MKKIFLIIFITFSIINAVLGYDAAEAVDYANYWSTNVQAPSNYKTAYNDTNNSNHDPDVWYDYEPGSDGTGDDCANFVSQCLITGGLNSLITYAQKYPPSGNQYIWPDANGNTQIITNATIIDVTNNKLQDFLTNEYHAAYIYAEADTSIMDGDVLVMPQGTNMHAVFIASTDDDNLYFDAHTNDRQSCTFPKDKGLNSVYASYQFSFFHIYPTVPYVQHVTVVQGSTLIYDAHWDGGDGQAKTLTPATQAARNPGFVDTGIDTAITMTITFNESVKNVIVYFFDQNGNSLNCTAGTGNGYPSASFGNTAGLNANGTVWSGTLTTAQIATLQNPAVMHISASNFASACNQLDANPGTQAEWNDDTKIFDVNYENNSDPLKVSNNETGGEDTNHSFSVVPKGYVVFNGADGYLTVKVADGSETPTPQPTPQNGSTETPTSTPATYPSPVITDVPVDKFIKGMLYSLVGSSSGTANFSDPKYLNGFEAMAEAAYTLLLNESEANHEYNHSYDILVNGYAADQPYYIPYTDFGNDIIPSGTKSLIDKAVKAVMITAGSGANEKYYLKAFWFNNFTLPGINDQFTTTRYYDKVIIPILRTILFSYARGKDAQNAVIQSGMNVFGEPEPYLNETLTYEADEDVPQGLVNGTMAGMSAWGAMYMSAYGFSVDNILKMYYHWAPTYLNKVVIKQNGQTVYDVSYGNASYTKGAMVRSMVHGSDEKPGFVSNTPASVMMYFSQNLLVAAWVAVPPVLHLKNTSAANPASDTLISLPAPNDDSVIAYNSKKEVFSAAISPTNFGDMMKNGVTTTTTVILAVDAMDGCTGEKSDQNPVTVAFPQQNSSGNNISSGSNAAVSAVNVADASVNEQGYEGSVNGSDETNSFAIMYVADYDSSSTKTSYSNAVNVSPGASVSLSFPTVNLNIDWATLLKSLIPNFSSFDLFDAIKNILPNIDISCLSQGQIESLKSVNMQSATFVASAINSGESVADFLNNSLKLSLPVCFTGQLTGINLSGIFKIPSVKFSGLNINLPRPDLSGCKWGLDTSKWNIAWIPDKLQGPDISNWLAAMFKQTLNFRGLTAPQFHFIQINTGDSNGISGWLNQSSICGDIDSGVSGALNALIPASNTSGIPGNTKLLADGAGGNAALDYLTNGTDGIGNTFNAHVMDDLSSVAIAGAFLGTGTAIDQHAIDNIMELQNIAKDVSAGMAIVGALQMVTNPGFGQYLLQGAVGYLKTWAEGTIKAYAFDGLESLLKQGLSDSQIGTLTQRLPGGVNFPGFSSGVNAGVSEIKSIVNSGELAQDIMGCKAQTDLPDLSKIDWTDVLNAATSVASYIEQYDGTKNDLVKDGAWLNNFASRDLSAVTANLSKLKNLTIKASGGDGSSPLTVNESMMSTIGNVIGLLNTVPNPVVSGIANIAPIVVSIFNSSKGNLLSTVENQLGSDNPMVKNIENTVAEKGTAIIKTLKIGDFPNIGSILPAGINFNMLPFIGDLVNQVMGSLSYGRGQQMNPGEILSDVDQSGAVGIFYPYSAAAQSPLTSYDGALCGLSTNHALLHTEGWASDYLPQFLQVYAQADNGPIVTTVLELDTTLVTTPDGKAGKADWALDIPMPHGGSNTVKIWTINAGGHRVDMQFTAYLDGTSFPQEGSRVAPVSSFIWNVSTNGIAGIGAQVQSQGGGLISFLNADPGQTPLSDVFDVATSMANDAINVMYPDNSPDPDLDIVDETGNTVVSSVPADGRFRFRLKKLYTGKSFVSIMGDADAKLFRQYRVEYAPGWINKGDTQDSYFADNGIVASNDKSAGPLFNGMASWDVSSKKLSGEYTLRTTVDDDNEGYYYVSNTAEIDRAHFTIGTPIDVSNAAGTIFGEPYMKFQVYVPAGAVKQTVYESVYIDNEGPVNGLESSGYDMMTPKYGIYPGLDAQTLNSGSGGLTITAKYTDDDLNIYNMDSNFDLDPSSADYGTQKAAAEQVIAQNLGIYRETQALDGSGNTVTTMALLPTGQPLGTHTIFTVVPEASGKYFVLPASSAPVLRYPSVASPFIFDPGDDSKGRTCTAFYIFPMTATSKYVFADIKIMQEGTTRLVRDLYDGIEKKDPITLSYAGKYGDIDTYIGKKYYFYNFDPAKDYKSVLAAPINGIVWDGMGMKQDGTNGIVEDGVYRANITVMDAFGNSTTGSCVVVKGKIVSEITQIGGLAAKNGMTLSAADWPNGIAAVMGTASGAEAFKGYRVGYRPTNYESDTGSNDPDDGYTYINLPKELTAGAVTTTVMNAQVIGGTLADLEVASIPNGNYDLRLFILGDDGTGNIVVMDRATISNINIQTQPGIYNLQASPNPFASVVTMTADVYTTDYAPVTFNVKDSYGNTLALIPGVNVSGMQFQAVWDASTEPDGYYSVSVTADNFEKDIQMRKYSSTDEITATIEAPASGSSVTSGITVTGSAGVADSVGETIPVKMDYYEVYSQVGGGDWTLVNRSADPVSNGWLANIPIDNLGGNSMNIRLIVHDTAGNTKLAESDAVNVDFNATLSVSPSTYVRGIGETIAFDYSINENVDAINFYTGSPGSQGGAPVNYRQFIISDPSDLAAGMHRIYWDAGNTISTGQIPVELDCIKNGAITKVMDYITSCDPSQVTDMPGVTINAYGVPKPYFEYSVTGNGMYDKPIAVTYTVTGYATEQWFNQHLPNPLPNINATSNKSSANATSNLTYQMHYNQTGLTFTAKGTGCSSGCWGCGNNNHTATISVNGTSVASNGSIGNSTWTGFINNVNINNKVELNAYAYKSAFCGQPSTTTLSFSPYELDLNPSLTAGSGTSAVTPAIIYSHSGASNPFLIKINALHTSDWNYWPQHGFICNSFYCASTPVSSNQDNGLQPVINYGSLLASARISGLAGSLDPSGDYYITLNPGVIPAVKKFYGTQSGTVGTSITKALDITVTAQLSITFTYGSAIITDYYNVKGYLYIPSAVFGTSTTFKNQQIDFMNSAKSATQGTFKSVNGNPPKYFTGTVSDGYTTVSFSNIQDPDSNGVVIADVTITRKSLQSAWALAMTETVRDNTVLFNIGGTQEGQDVNIFQSLDGQYGSGINPFPNSTEDAQAAAAGCVTPGPDSDPHTSYWSVKGPYYPDSTDIHDDVVLGKGTYVTSLNNNYGISFGSVTSTTSDGFEEATTYDGYDEDKVDFRLKEPSTTPYESRTYIKISGTVNVPNLIYYALSYKKTDTSDDDDYHQFKYSTMTASGTLGYLPVKDKIGAYDILLSVVVNNAGDIEAYQAHKAVNIGYDITPRDGGTATDAYEQAFLYFPKGALRDEKYITITPLSRDELPILQQNLIPACLIYSFQAVNPGESDGDHLRTDDFVQDSLGNIPIPSTLTIEYDPKQLGGYDESDLSLYKLDIPQGGSQAELMLIPSYVDKVNHVITTELTSFSTVQLIPNTAPPTFQFSASPDPAGLGSIVDIYIKSTKTLKNNLTGSVTLPDTGANYPNGRTVPVTFTMQSKPYLSGTTDITTSCVDSVLDSKQFILGSEGNTNLPCDGESNTVLAGTRMIISYPGTSVQQKTFYINRAGTYNNNVTNGTNNMFWVTLVDAPGNTVNEVNIADIIVGTTDWNWTDPVTGKIISGVMPQQSNCTNTLVLMNTTPGEPLAFPPVNWWDGKGIVIGGSTYTLTGVTITGNDMTGAQVTASLLDLSSNPVVITDAIGNTSWTLYAPVSEYQAKFNVAANVPAGVSGEAEVDFNGADMAGNTGSGTGYFYINTSMTPVTVATDKDIVKNGDTLNITAKSNIEGELPSINLYKYPSGVTLTVDASKISNIVVPGTGLYTGESTYQYVVQPPELLDYEGLIEAVAGVTLCSSDGSCIGYYASKTVTVDTKSPQFDISLINYTPLGVGNYLLNITASENLSAPTEVKISALNGNGGGWDSILENASGGGTVYNAPMQVKASYVYTSITVEVTGYDLAGNTGTAVKIFPLDTQPPGQLTGLAGYRAQYSSGGSGYYENMLSWDSLAPETPDLKGYDVFRDGALVAASPVTVNAFTDVLSGPGFDTGSSESHTYYVAGVDFSGNTGAGAYITIVPDSFAPVTTLDITGNSFTAFGGTIYIGASSQLSLSAVDKPAPGEAGSGVNYTGYNFNNADPSAFNTYSTPFTCPYSDTMTAVYFRSVDNNGNSEAVKSSRIYLDTTPPGTVLDIAGPYYLNYGNFSGISLTIPADIESWDRNEVVGEITSTASALFTPAMVDALLNTTETSDEELEYLLTSTAKTGDADYNTNTSPSNTGIAYMNGSYVRLSITANDNINGIGSGVKGAYYSIDNGPTVPFSLFINISGLSEGMHTIETGAVDNVGNSTTIRGYGSNVNYFVIDDTPPTTSAVLDIGGVTETAGPGSVTLSVESGLLEFAATDKGPIPSGLRATYFTINGGALEIYATPVTFTPGSYDINYFSVDNVSNTESAKILELSIMAPSPSPTYSITATYTVTITPTITATQTDTNTETVTPTITMTETPTGTVTETVTQTNTETVTSTATGTFTITMTGTPTQTVTESSTETDLNTATETASGTATITMTATPTQTVTLTSTATVTETVTETASGTPTVTMTVTPTETVTGTLTETGTNTVTKTATGTSTITMTGTPTNTITATSAGTSTRTVSNTVTDTSTATKTFTATPTYTATATYTGTYTRTATVTLTGTYTFTPTCTSTTTTTPTATPTFTVTATVTPQLNGIYLMFKDAINDEYTNSPHPWFKLYNNGTTPVNLSGLEIRYWYKYEGTGQQEYSYVDSAVIMNSGTHIDGSVTSSIVSGSFGNQDRYLKVDFASGAGVLEPGEYADIETRFNKSDWSNYNQGNDYSFTAVPDYVVWEYAAVYMNGALVWGYPPSDYGMLSYIPKYGKKPIYEALSGGNTYNYPNPFSSDTVIRFSIAFAEDVDIRVYDLTGSLVWKKMVKNVGAGINEVTWDGRTSGNRFVADGLYLCRVSASDGSVEFKMAVIRK